MERSKSGPTLRPVANNYIYIITSCFKPRKIIVQNTYNNVQVVVRFYKFLFLYI